MNSPDNSTTDKGKGSPIIQFEFDVKFPRWYRWWFDAREARVAIDIVSETEAILLPEKERSCTFFPTIREGGIGTSGSNCQGELGQVATVAAVTDRRARVIPKRSHWLLYARTVRPIIARCWANRASLGASIGDIGDGDVTHRCGKHASRVSLFERRRDAVSPSHREALCARQSPDDRATPSDARLNIMRGLARYAGEIKRDATLALSASPAPGS